MSNKPILFYSPKCTHSIELWKKLKENNILDKILKINVSNATTIPNNVKRTPTLLINGRQPLIGQAIEFYLRNPQPNKQQNEQTQQPIIDNNIQDYMPEEMNNSWSDNYSFIDNNNPIDHSFQWLNQNNTIKCSKPMLNNKKGNVIDNRLETLKKERNLDLHK